MNHRRLTPALAACAALALLSPLPALAGDLNPPPGPIQPTNRVQINQQTIGAFPYTISQPGSYVLTSNITGVSGADGIVIASRDVVLDLNGFTVQGVAGSTAGIRISGNAVTVVNGRINGWGAEGIASGSAGLVVRDVQVWGNAARGMNLGNNAIVERCIAFDNLDAGIRVGASSVIIDSIARNNASGGFLALPGSTITGSTSTGNTGTGIAVQNNGVIENCTARNNVGDGIAAGESSVIRGSTATGNTGDGVVADVGSSISDSVASDNTGIGFLAFPGATIQNCNAQDNGSHGYELGRAQPGQSGVFHGVTVSNSTASSNGGNGFFANNANGPGSFTSCNAYANTLNGFLGTGNYDACQANANGEHGFNIANGSTVTNSNARGNVLNGIIGGQGSTIIGCTARFNKGFAGIGVGEGVIRDCATFGNDRHGIAVDRQALVINNASSQNGVGDGITDGAGIYVGAMFGGTASRIDSNNVTFNDVGIRTVAGGNQILRNTASGNTTNYSLTGVNNVGTIQTGAFTAGSAGPWDNFAF